MAESTPAPPRTRAASSSRAVETSSPSAGWGLLYRYAFVVSAGDLQGGDEFEAHVEEPPRASSLAISRALLVDAANPRTAAFVHGVDASGRLLLCSVTQGPGTERLFVCQAGRGKASPLPEVPAALELRLSTRDVVGIASDPRSGGHIYAVAQLHAEPVSAPPSASATETAPSAPPTARTSATMASVMPPSGQSSSAPSATERSATLMSSVMEQSAIKHSRVLPADRTSSSTMSASVSSLTSLAMAPSATERSATAPSAPSTTLMPLAMAPSATAPSAPITTLTSLAMAQAATKCSATTASFHTGSGTAASPPSAPVPAPAAPVHGLRLQLLIYSSSDITWKVKSLLTSPLSNTLVGFRSETVIADDETLIFVDLTCGIVLWKPLNNQPEARFVPFPELHSQVAGDCCIGKRRCMALSEGKLTLAVIGDSPAGPGITVWRFNDVNWEKEWQLSFHVLGNWLPSDPPELISIDPTASSRVLLLNGGNCICVADLIKQLALERDEFFINVGNMTPSSLHFCNWLLPPCLAAADEGPIYSLKKTKKSSLLKYPKMAYNLLENSKRYIDLADRSKTWFGPAVDQVLGVPVSSVVSTASSYLKRGIEVGEVLGSAFPCPAPPEELKVVTIENEDQAWSAIKSWRDAGTPPFTYVAFADGMKEADITALKQFVIDHGAKPLLWLVE
ncbi:hypothetical protein EJB05_49720, partial [Eragrostis curvula]